MLSAADKILQKALVGSPMNSAQWARIQAGLRDRAFFSARVEDVRRLAAARTATAEHAAGAKSLSETRRDIRDALAATGYVRPEGGEGTITDLMTQRRLDLIIKTNVQQARGWKQYMEGTTPGALAAFPAQRLIRVRQRRMPRDWASRWRMAGEATGWEGASREEMTALKTSPIWRKLSRFGNPFPPFDFNSGMELEDVGKRRTVELGLANREELNEMVKKAAEAPVPDFNANLATKVTPDEGEMLRERFGDQVDISDGMAKWVERPFAGMNPGETRSMPGADGLVTVPAASVAGLSADLEALLPSMLREGGVFETLTGDKLLAEVVNGIFKGIVKK